jgi:3-oxoadipate CoA-transferase alpha subunit
VFSSPETAVADVFDGAVVLIGGFAGDGIPESLLEALGRQRARDLTCICQGVWPAPSDASGVAQLVANGQVKKLISPLPIYPGVGGPVEERWRSEELEVEVVPQGTLAERLRAGGAGLGGVFLPTGVGVRFQDGKESRRFGGQECILELPLHADFALLRADAADTLGNLVYRGTRRNWNPVMAMAATITIAEVDQIYEPGGLDPEAVITPGIFVRRVIQTGRPDRRQRGRA